MKKIFCVFLMILTVLPAPQVLRAETVVRYQEPEFLTFDELKTLSDDPHPGGALEQKLNRFWTTPIISNEAFFQGATPRGLVHSKLGRTMRISTWNIEKSFNTEQVIKLLSNPSSMALMLNKERVKPFSLEFKKMRQQLERLANSDVFILQEMDIGNKRSGYINAAGEIAKALKMNYAYGAEQLEIDPVVLGLQKVAYEEGGVDQEATDFMAVDPKKYKGVFGSAVLSKYPIKHVEVFQLKNQAYDWFWGEKPKPTYTEKARRVGTELIFKNIITREMKVGGRIYFRVDLEVPELPEKTLTIINIHLEIKCQPKGREAQMSEILDYIKKIRHPVIVAGDFNAAPNDISSTSITRIIKRTAQSPTTWFQIAVTYLSPYALMINTTRGLSNVTKNFQNPFAKNIPVIAPNPLYKMFKMIEDFRFEDGGTFDFRGDAKRTINGKVGKLANSNQRDLKGFKTTFQVKRPLGPVIGKLRLDWLFVKSFLTYPEDVSGSYRFAPHFGETLEELNTGLWPQPSDHHPSVIDLPLEESANKKL